MRSRGGARGLPPGRRRELWRDIGFAAFGLEDAAGPWSPRHRRHIAGGGRRVRTRRAGTVVRSAREPDPAWPEHRAGAPSANGAGGRSAGPVRRALPTDRVGSYDGPPAIERARTFIL